MRHFRRWLTATAVATCTLAAAASTAAAARPHVTDIDSNCHRTDITFNHLFNEYVPEEGAGWIAYRYAGDLNVYDHCQHGGIIGAIDVSPAVIKAKGGRYYLRFWYDTPQYRWTSNYLYFRQEPGNNYWDTYGVFTEGNIGLPSNGTISQIQMGGWTVFDGNPFGYTHVTCTVATRACSYGGGL